MATQHIDAQSAIKKALDDFRIADTTPLWSVGQDATDEILPMIYSLATALEMGFRKNGGESALDNTNPEIIACAFDGIAELAALALFRAQLPYSDECAPRASAEGHGA